MPAIVEMLERRFGRVVTLCRDLPAFAGNRVGFKVLNECAQLAAEHGVAFIDYLIGPYTGRAMPPLATVDLVGWDVHKAIVDNVHANTKDEAHDAFALPAYVAELIDEGHLGNKTPERGGFYRRTKEDGKTVNLVLDPKSGGYRSPADVTVEPIPFVEQMRELHHVGRYARGVRGLRSTRAAPRPIWPARSSSATSATRSTASATARSCASRATSTASWASASTGRRRPCWSTSSACKETIKAHREGRPAGAEGAGQGQARRAPVPRAGRQHRPLLRRLKRDSVHLHA